MNRKNKFRVWDNANKIWFNSDNVVLTTEGKAFHKYLHYDLSCLEIVSFTGLKDKNGVEIYEGDIISVSNNGAFIGNCEIVWKGCGFWFKDVDFTSETYENLFVYDQAGYGLEVISNIYENLESAEVTND